jgi:hypothetical protein
VPFADLIAECSLQAHVYCLLIHAYARESD